MACCSKVWQCRALCDDHFRYDWDSEEENKFLAAVDLEAVNITDKVDKVTVEKADRSTEVNKQICNA